MICACLAAEIAVTFQRIQQPHSKVIVNGWPVVGIPHRRQKRPTSRPAWNRRRTIPLRLWHPAQPEFRLL